MQNLTNVISLVERIPDPNFAVFVDMIVSLPVFFKFINLIYDKIKPDQRILKTTGRCKVTRED